MSSKSKLHSFENAKSSISSNSYTSPLCLPMVLSTKHFVWYQLLILFSMINVMSPNTYICDPSEKYLDVTYDNNKHRDLQTRRSCTDLLMQQNNLFVLSLSHTDNYSVYQQPQHDDAPNPIHQQPPPPNQNILHCLHDEPLWHLFHTKNTAFLYDPDFLDYVTLPPLIDDNVNNNQTTSNRQYHLFTYYSLSDQHDGKTTELLPSSLSPIQIWSNIPRKYKVTSGFILLIDIGFFLVIRNLVFADNYA